MHLNVPLKSSFNTADTGGKDEEEVLRRKAKKKVEKRVRGGKRCREEKTNLIYSSGRETQLCYSSSSYTAAPYCRVRSSSRRNNSLFVISTQLI